MGPSRSAALRTRRALRAARPPLGRQVSQTAVACAGEPLSHFDVHAQGQRGAGGERYPNAVSIASRLDTGHQEEGAKQHDVPIIAERHQREGNIELEIAGPRSRPKGDARRKEHQAQRDESGVGPAGTAKGHYCERQEDGRADEPDELLHRRWAPCSRKATGRRLATWRRCAADSMTSSCKSSAGDGLRARSVDDAGFRRAGFENARSTRAG